MIAAPQTKQCTKCGETKPVAAFHRNRNLKGGHHPHCAACKAVIAKGQYQRWTPEQRTMHRKRVFRTRYGIEIAMLDQMYELQEGCCAVCGTRGERPGDVENGDRMTVLHIDHNHKTGNVRGLLCIGCNIGLGGFRDDPVRLVSAAHYIQKHGGQ